MTLDTSALVGTLWSSARASAGGLQITGLGLQEPVKLSPHEPVEKPRTVQPRDTPATITHFDGKARRAKAQQLPAPRESSNRQPCQGAAPARKRSTRSRTRRWQAARKR